MFATFRDGDCDRTEGVFGGVDRSGGSQLSCCDREIEEESCSWICVEGLCLVINSCSPEARF